MSNPATTEKKKTGRPTKYSKELYPKIRKLCKLGATDKDIAELLDINQDTFHEWKKKHPEFSEFLKESKVITDEDMEKSLRLRAMGCTTKEVKNVRRLNKETGRLEDYETVETLKEHPPETKAIERWLFNRNPDRWKDKTENIVKTINEDGEETGINININFTGE